MNPLTIPPCPHRPARGDNWPSHKAKARAKHTNRRRIIAALNEENRLDVRNN